MIANALKKIRIWTPEFNMHAERRKFRLGIFTAGWRATRTRVRCLPMSQTL